METAILIAAGVVLTWLVVRSLSALGRGQAPVVVSEPEARAVPPPAPAPAPARTTPPRPAVTLRPGESEDSLIATAFDERGSSDERVRALRLLASIAEPGALVAHLGRALASPSFALRHAAIHAAIDASPNDYAARALVRRELSRLDGDLDTRFFAAKALGAEGVTHLDAIVFESPEAPPEMRAKAFRAVLEHLPVEERVTRLEKALATRVEALQIIAIESLTALGRELKPLELRELARDGREQTALAVAAALEKIHGTPSELVLVELLERKEPAVLAAAVRALAEVGTARAMEALDQALARTTDETVKILTRRAKDSIRARLGAGAGGLSIAPVDGGALSLAEDARGNLSTPDTDTKP